MTERQFDAVFKKQNNLVFHLFCIAISTVLTTCTTYELPEKGGYNALKGGITVK